MQIAFSNTASLARPNSRPPRRASLHQANPEPRFSGFFSSFIKATIISAGASVAAGQLNKHGGKVLEKLTGPLKDGLKELKDNWNALGDTEKLSEGAPPKDDKKGKLDEED